MSTIRLLCNAGVRLTLDGETILIDPFYGGGCPPYLPIPGALFEQTLNLGADALVYTHLHPDHFDLPMTMRFMARHPETPVIVPAEIAARLLKSGADMTNVHALSLARETIRTGALSVTALPTRHLGPHFENKEHYSILVEGSERILHTGDASPVIGNYEALAIGAIDVAIAGFAYFTNRSGRRLFASVLPIKNLVVVHLPDRSDDPEGLRPLADAALENEYPYKVFVPERIGEEFSI